MRRRRSQRVILAAAASILWLAFWGVLLVRSWDEVHTLKFNEWGDFLAGITGPLAFFWLIVGYFQQGEELEQNTDALKLQAEELRQMVAQQKEIVKVAKEDVELARTGLSSSFSFHTDFKSEIDNSIKPAVIRQQFELTNIGSTAGDVRVRVSDQVRMEPNRFHSISKDEDVQLTLVLPARSKKKLSRRSSTFFLEYVDASRNLHRVRFRLKYSDLEHGYKIIEEANAVAKHCFSFKCDFSTMVSIDAAFVISQEFQIRYTGNSVAAEVQIDVDADIEIVPKYLPRVTVNNENQKILLKASQEVMKRIPRRGLVMKVTYFGARNTKRVEYFQVVKAKTTDAVYIQASQKKL